MRGSVKKEGNSWYYVFYLEKDVNGKRRQKKKRGFKTKKEAQKALTEAINAINKGTYVEPSSILYKDYLEDWFSTKQKTIGIQTAKNYEQYLHKKIIPELGSIQLSKLTTMKIQKFINNLSEQGLASATVKKIFEIIKNSLEHAVDFELVMKNAARKVKLPKMDRKEIEVWSENEINKFLNTAEGDPFYMVFHLALTTGMRQGEILGLRWKDVDLDKGKLSIKQTLSHDGKFFISGAKTKASLRTIPLPEATIKRLITTQILIKEQKEKFGIIYEDHDLVVCTQHGTPINPANVRRSFNRLIELANVPKIRFHDLRHTHATLLLSKGVPPKVVAERLGHSNIKITLDTYSHVLPTMQEDVIRKIDEIIKDNQIKYCLKAV